MQLLVYPSEILRRRAANGSNGAVAYWIGGNFELYVFQRLVFSLANQCKTTASIFYFTASMDGV